LEFLIHCQRDRKKKEERQFTTFLCFRRGLSRLARVKKIFKKGKKKWNGLLFTGQDISLRHPTIRNIRRRTQITIIKETRS
jgi:hypothetical protein